MSFDCITPGLGEKRSPCDWIHGHGDTRICCTLLDDLIATAECICDHVRWHFIDKASQAVVFCTFLIDLRNPHLLACP